MSFEQFGGFNTIKPTNMETKKDQEAQEELREAPQKEKRRFRFPPNIWNKILMPALITLGVFQGDIAKYDTMAQETAFAQCQVKPDDIKVPEKEDAAQNFERVKAQCTASAMKNEDLRQEIGDKNLEKLIETINKTKFGETDTMLSQVSNIPIEDIEKEKTAYIYLLSQAEMRDTAKLSRQFDGLEINKKQAATEWIHDEIFLNASAFINTKGEVDGDRLQHTITHEYLHVLTTEFTALSNQFKSKAEVIPWIVECQMPDVFYEGATEYIASLISFNQDIKRSPGGYEVGALAASFIAQAVGPEVFIRDYLKGDIAEIEANFDEKFGEGAFKDLTQGDPEIDLFRHDADVQVKFLSRLIQILKGGNFDFQAAQRSALGMNIANTVISNSDTANK